MRMKNKKNEQIADRKRHREQLKSKRRQEPSLERKSLNLSTKPSILIVCEGENTEKSYFDQFRVSSAVIKSVGTGFNTCSLVNRAKKIADVEEYNQVWCVFDKDEFSNYSFNKAVHNAEKLGYGVAYSNQAFEYWLILHLDDHQGSMMNRENYKDKINELLKPFGIEFDADGRKIVKEDLFDILNGIDHKSKKKRVDLAIERAEKIYNCLDHRNPATEESSTTVFKLVSELMKYV